MRQRLVFSLIFLAVLGLSFGLVYGREGRLRVVTSFLPIQSHAAAIAGERAEVSQLLGKETGAHDFQPSPGDVRKLAEADLFFINGMGLEDWLDALVKNSGNPKLKVVDTSIGISVKKSSDSVIEIGDDDGHESGDGEGLAGRDADKKAKGGDHGVGEAHQHGDGHGEGSEHGHCHEHEGNPHIWLDPVYARHQAEVILAALVEADPEGREVFEGNAREYFRKLEDLDKDFREVLGPLENKNLVTFHDAFFYLAARYGLRYLGYVARFPETEPSPRQVANLVEKIKAFQVGVVFSELGYKPLILEMIARETGARVMQLDTLELGIGSPTAYLERMRKNLQVMRASFKGGPM